MVVGWRLVLGVVAGVVVALTTVTSQGAQESFAIVAPETYVREAGASEEAQAAVQESLEATLVAGIESRDWTRAAKAFTDRFRGRLPAPGAGRVVEDRLLEIEHYAPKAVKAGDRASVLAALRTHTDGWVAVDRASWHAFEFLLHPDGRQAYMKAHFQLGGPEASGARTVLDATVAAVVVKTHRRRDGSGADRWQLSRLDVTEATRVRNPSPPFRELTDAVGLHFNRSAENDQLRQEVADTGMSLIDSAIGVVDWNRDGFWDVLVTEAASHALLFLNDAKGGFVRQDLPFPDPLLIPSQTLYLDLDGDGQEELVGSRVVYRGDRAWIGLRTRVNGTWVERPRALEFENPAGLRRNETQLITAGDVNADGLVDIFVGGYQNNRSGKPSRFNRVDATDGDDNLLFINRGDLTFTEESERRDITGTRYTYVAEFFDFDDDGDLDLFEGNDFGPNAVWLNRGDGSFQASPDHPLARQSSNTMGITIGDWDNRGQWSVYLSNMYSHAGHRVVRLADSVSLEMQKRLAGLARGNQLFEMGESGNVWTDRGVERGVNEAGWAWASVFYDIDNDGDKEIFVTNGNTSHADQKAPDF